MDNNIFIASRSALLLQICQFRPAFPIFPSSLTHPGPIHACDHWADSGGRLQKNSCAWNASMFNPPSLISLHFYSDVISWLSSSLTIIPLFPLCNIDLSSSLLSCFPLSPPPLLSSPQKHFKKQIRLLTGVRDWHFPPPLPAAGVPLYILADTAQLWATISQFCESLTQWFISSASDKWPQLCK